MRKMIVAVVLGLLLAYPMSAKAEINDALLQKLVDKGTLTSEEAEGIQSKSSSKGVSGVSIGGLVYYSYSFGETGNGKTTPYNRFTLDRAYINVYKEITPWFKVRITPDIKSTPKITKSTVDSGTPDATPDYGYAVRMKFAYADFLTSDMGVLTDTAVRVGLGHTPWLDFEETFNTYRMQSQMFQNKRGLVDASDAGVSILGNIGGKLNEDQIKKVGNKGYAGRYGTYHIGAYNGGTYNQATENNQDKTIQGRLSVRPLPDILPGLQLTYFGITGEANNNNSLGTKNYIDNTGFVSYQHRYVLASAEYYSGDGNFQGDDILNKKSTGYSFFGKVVLPMYEKVAFYGRYDLMDRDTDSTSDQKIETTIGGASYKIYGENYLVAAYEKTHDHADSSKDDVKGQVVLQLSF